MDSLLDRWSWKGKRLGLLPGTEHESRRRTRGDMPGAESVAVETLGFACTGGTTKWYAVTTFRYLLCNANFDRETQFSQSPATKEMNHDP